MGPNDMSGNIQMMMPPNLFNFMQFGKGNNMPPHMMGNQMGNNMGRMPNQWMPRGMGGGILPPPQLIQDMRANPQPMNQFTAFNNNFFQARNQKNPMFINKNVPLPTNIPQNNINMMPGGINNANNINNMKGLFNKKRNSGKKKTKKKQPSQTNIQVGVPPGFLSQIPPSIMQQGGGGQFSPSQNTNEVREGFGNNLGGEQDFNKLSGQNINMESLLENERKKNKKKKESE